MRSTSQYYQSRSAYSPVIEIDDDSHSKFVSDSRSKQNVEDGEDNDFKRESFRFPRNCILNFSAEFLVKCTAKLNEINKKSSQEKQIELLDQKCYIRLNEIASSLVKLSPHDMETMQAPGLQLYMSHVFPNTDWSQVAMQYKSIQKQLLINQVAMKPVLISFIRRLEKMMMKIHKNQRIYVSTDWASLSTILLGLYETFWKFPHVMVNIINFKTLLGTCQCLALGEDSGNEPNTASFNRKVIKLILIFLNFG